MARRFHPAAGIVVDLAAGVALEVDQIAAAGKARVGDDRAPVVDGAVIAGTDHVGVGAVLADDAAGQVVDHRRRAAAVEAAEVQHAPAGFHHAGIVDGDGRIGLSGLLRGHGAADRAAGFVVEDQRTRRAGGGGEHAARSFDQAGIVDDGSAAARPDDGSAGDQLAARLDRKQVVAVDGNGGGERGAVLDGNRGVVIGRNRPGAFADHQIFDVDDDVAAVDDAACGTDQFQNVVAVAAIDE